MIPLTKAFKHDHSSRQEKSVVDFLASALVHRKLELAVFDTWDSNYLMTSFTKP